MSAAESVGVAADSRSPSGHFDELPMRNYCDIADGEMDYVGTDEDLRQNSLLDGSTYIPASTLTSLTAHHIAPNSAGQASLAQSANGNSSDRFTDDPLVYANLEEISKKSELEDIDRRPYPPLPGAGDEPLRVLPSGWKEYKTQGGRSFYFHPEDGGKCQWKPPRLKKTSASSSSLGTPTGHHPSPLLPCEPHSHYPPFPSLNNPMTTLRQWDDFRQLNSAIATNESAEFTSKPQAAENFAEMPLCSSSDHSTEHRQPNGTSWQGDSTAMGQLLDGHHSSPYELSPCSDSAAAATTFSAMSQGVERGERHTLGKVFTNHPQHQHQYQQHHHVYISPPLQPSFINQNAFEAHSLLGTVQQNKFSGAALKQGPLDKCKLVDNGVKAKKREWVSAYAYLYSGHFLFYKDQKSAEKCGKHYPTPTEVCDLRGAICCYADPEGLKERRKKTVIHLTLVTKTEYLFTATGHSNPNEIDSWFNTLRHTIAGLPPVTQTYPTPVLAGGDLYGSLQRCTPATCSTRTSKFHQSVKSKFRSSSSSKENTLEKSNHMAESSTPSKESIIERLLAFFRIRPSVESLRERGIYKPEPVFGSTLSAICTHERTSTPRFVTEVLRLIEERGLETDGLYRVNANLASVQRIRCQIDQDRYEPLIREEDVHVLTGALKLFFRELSEPLFPISMNKDFMSAIREPNIRQRFAKIDELLNRLPPFNRETLTVLVKHLEKVATYSRKNRMQIHNLAIIFGPSLFSADDRPVQQRKLSSDKMGKKDVKKRAVDKRPSADDSGSVAFTSQPNLAYKMVVYGQIVEFILNESQRFQVFRQPS